MLQVWQLPSVGAERIREFPQKRWRRERAGAAAAGKGQRTSDGRDKLLRDLVAAEIARWKARGWALERDGIVRDVWRRFSQEADLTRAKGAGGGSWCVEDVVAGGTAGGLAGREINFIAAVHLTICGGSVTANAIDSSDKTEAEGEVRGAQ